MYASASTAKSKGKVQARTVHQDPEGEQRYSPTPPITLVPDQGRWSMPCRSHFIPAKQPTTHCTVGWVYPWASMGKCGISCPHQALIPRLCNPQPVAIPTMLTYPT
jgi:hypothetical protein